MAIVNPDWYKGGCLICGKKDCPGEPIIACKFFAAEVHYAIPEDLLVINSSDGRGIPFCGDCGYEKGLSFFYDRANFYECVREAIWAHTSWNRRGHLVEFPNGTCGFNCMTCKAPCPYVETGNRPNNQYECGSCRVTFG